MSRNQLPTLCIMPVKGLLRDLPLAVPLEQSENLGNAGIRSGQLSRPALDFEVHDGDGFEDLNAREPWMDIRRRAILFDPIEQVLDRSAVFDPLTVAGYGGLRVKSRPHQFAIAGSSARDVAVDCACYRVMLNEVVVSRLMSPRESV